MTLTIDKNIIDPVGMGKMHKEIVQPIRNPDKLLSRNRLLELNRMFNKKYLIALGEPIN